MDGVSLGLNATRSSGHSSELGMRLRGAITPRLYYGVAGAWLGVSLMDALSRTTTVDSHQRDGSRRGSVSTGLGYLLTPHTVVSLDFAGVVTRTQAFRTEDATGNLLQTGADNHRLVSAHAAVERYLSRRLFVSASLLGMWHSGKFGVALFPDRFGNSAAVKDAFFRLAPSAYRPGNRFSDFGVGWRILPDCFAQYLYTTSYGASAATHTFMLRYTFNFRREGF